MSAPPSQRSTQPSNHKELAKLPSFLPFRFFNLLSSRTMSAGGVSSPFRVERSERATDEPELTFSRPLLPFSSLLF